MTRLLTSRLAAIALCAYFVGEAVDCPGQAVPPPAESLATARQIALTVDDRLAGSSHRLFAAEREQARSRSERWPTLSVRGGYEVRTDEQAFVVSPDPFLVDPQRLPYRQRESASLEARASVPLYTSGRISSHIAAADASAASTAYARDAVRLDVLRDIGESFVDVLRQQRVAGVRELSVRTLARHAEDVRLRFEQGMATQNELLTARVRHSTAEQELLQARHALELAWADYNRRLKRPLGFRTTLQEPDVPAAAASLEELMHCAERDRPEAAELGARVQSLGQKAEAVRQSRLPQVYAQGGFYFEENRFQAPEEVGYLGVVVDWTLTDGGAAAHGYDAARERSLAVQRQRAELMDLIRLEVYRAWLELSEARNRRDATMADIAHADENLRVTMELFQGGMAKSGDVLEAEKISSESRLRHFHALCDAVSALVRLERATGTRLP